jgi:hypothetical protein
MVVKSCAEYFDEDSELFLPGKQVEVIQSPENGQLLDKMEPLVVTFRELIGQA